MSDPTQPAPRQTTRVLQAVQASHGRADTIPRYVVGGILIAFALGAFGFHLVTHGAAPLGVFEQRFIAACGLAGFGIIPPAEALLRFIGGAITAWKQYKNPQPPTQ